MYESVAAAANLMASMMLMKMCLNDFPHSTGFYGGYQQKLSDTGIEIIERAKLVPYRPYPPQGKASALPPRPKKEKVIRQRIRSVGAYDIVSKASDGSYQVMLFENRPGGKQVKLAYKTAVDVYEMDRIFDEVVDTAIQVRYEHRTALRRKG